MPAVSSVQSARGKLGFAAKVGDPLAISQARRDLAAAKIEEYVQRIVAEAPPLTASQRQKLAALLGGAA